MFALSVSLFFALSGTLTRLVPAAKVRAMSRGFYLLAKCFLGTCGLFAGEGASWPQFRGPTGQGIAVGPGPMKWSKDSGIAWKTKIAARGWASPVISENRVILTGSRGEGGSLRLGAFAIDATTGAPLWDTELFNPEPAETAAMHGKNSLASPTPFIEDGIAYVHFGHMGTAALRVTDGKILWKTKVSYRPMHGNGGSPVLVGDKLVVNADAENAPEVVALHKKDGSVAWRTPRNQTVKSSFSFCTPLVVQTDGRTEILSPGSGMIGAYAPEDGRLLWKVTYGEGYSVVPRPVVSDGMVFVATGYNIPKLLAIRLGNASGDVTKSHVAWELTRRVPKTPSMIADRGRVFTLDDTGTLTSTDSTTGKVAWSLKLPGNFSASPVLAGNTLYAVTEDGVCYVVNVSADEGEILFETDLAERTLASPALLGGVLYLRTEEHLWKITGT